MSIKSEIVAILSAKKEEKLAAVIAEFDALIAQVEALPEGQDPVLLQKVQELEAAVSSLIENNEKLQGKILQIKALLDA